MAETMPLDGNLPTSTQHNSDAKPQEMSSENWELRFGCTLALLAAVLAVNDLGAGKFGADELQFSNEKAGAYMWYQSKGIKESLAEGQAGLISSMLESRAIAEDAKGRLETHAQDLRSKIARYGAEKKEILLGSSAVGEKAWAQDVNGEMGKVVGAAQYGQAIETLSEAGDRFDLATLFLQLSLVIGAIGIIMRDRRSKGFFYLATIALGIVGAVMCLVAYRIALGITLG